MKGIILCKDDFSDTFKNELWYDMLEFLELSNNTDTIEFKIASCECIQEEEEE